MSTREEVDVRKRSPSRCRVLHRRSGSHDEPEANPVVEYATRLAVAVEVVQAGAVILDGVVVPETPCRWVLHFGLRRSERLGDLTDWPSANRRATSLSPEVIEALSSVLVAHGLTPMRLTGSATTDRPEPGGEA